MKTRRTFLKYSAAVAAPLVLPARLLGLEGAAPSEIVRMGFIGTGRQCFYKNIPLFQRLPNVRILAACDVDSWRLAQAAKRIDDYEAKARPSASPAKCTTYVDYQDLLARQDIDAVCISTPDHWHGTMGVEAMEAGKDVALEKPIIRTIDEGKKLVDASKRLGRVFRVDSEFRSGAPARKAFAIARSGRLGKLKKVFACVPQSDVGCAPQPAMPVPEELDFERWQGPAPRTDYTINGVHPRKGWGRPGWMRKLTYCDGMVTNWGTHLLNGALWCLDKDREWPVEIEGTGLYPAADSFWNVLLKFSVTYRYADGVELIYRTENPYLRIEGEDGWIDAGFGHFRSEPASLAQYDAPIITSPEPRQTSEKVDFIEAVSGPKPSLEPADVGHCVTSTCLLGHLAINLGEKLSFDGKNQRFVDNDRANAMLDKPITAPNPDLQQK